MSDRRFEMSRKELKIIMCESFAAAEDFENGRR